MPRERTDALTPEQSQMVLDNKGLAYNFAREQRKKGVDCLTRAELVSAAMLGLCYAARVYDPSRGTKFSTCAWVWMRRMAAEDRRSVLRLISTPISTKGVPDEFLPQVAKVRAMRRAPGILRVPTRSREHEAEGRELAEILDREISRLPKRYQIVARRRLIDDELLTTAGEEAGVTWQRARQIAIHVIAKLRVRMRQYA